MAGEFAVEPLDLVANRLPRLEVHDWTGPGSAAVRIVREIKGLAGVLADCLATNRMQ
jgi:hypothetical protein